MTDPAAEGSTTVFLRRSRGFILGYGAAQAGAFICFIPLLTLLLPEKAEQIGGADKALLLSQAAFLGGLTAAMANLLFGALSDGAKGRLGRRRPWILAGLVATALTLAFIASARDPLQLAIGVVAFQLAVNALYAPLTALVPDLVPDEQKGLVSSWAGIALPVANLFTALVVGQLAASVTAQFFVVIAAATVLILPFALTLKEPAAPRRQRAPFRLSFVALKNRTFSLAFGARLLLESAVAINTLYLLFFLQAQPAGSAPEGWSVGKVFGVMLIASTSAATVSGFVGGLLSDHLRRRRSFVIAGAACVAASLALFTGWSAWPGPLIAQLLFGVGHGLHATTVAAMTAEILPDPRKAGQDLGLMNMAVALPQSLAPAFAVALLSAGFSLSSVFAAASAAALLACAILMLMRRVP